MEGGTHLSREATDGELVARHKAGDPDAFAALYVRHRPRVYRYVAHRIQESHILEDLTQEAFATALASIGQLRNPERFYPWLTTIARRLVLRHYAARRHTIVLPEHLVSAAEPPESELLRQVTEQEVADALGRVTSRHRAVLDLRERQQLSYAAIAGRMQTSETAIPTLLHRARNALRREFMAVTDAERLGVIAVAIFGAFSLRRVRDRLGSLLRYVPDPAVWGGSVASMAVVVSMAIGTVAAVHDATPDVAPVAASYAELGGQAAAPSHELAGDVGDSDSDRDDAADESVRRVELDNGFRLGSYGLGNEAARRGHEDNKHMPYQAQVGGTSLGVDPQPLQNHVEVLLGAT